MGIQDIDETVTIVSRRGGKELYLSGPEWFFEYQGNISVKTPFRTYISYKKEQKSYRPITKGLLLKNYLQVTPNELPLSQDRNVPYNEIWFTKFGEETLRYEVLVSEEAVQDCCETYPAITIVEE